MESEQLDAWLERHSRAMARTVVMPPFGSSQAGGLKGYFSATQASGASSSEPSVCVKLDAAVHVDDSASVPDHMRRRVCLARDLAMGASLALPTWSTRPHP